MAEEPLARMMMRCILGGELFDFHQDLGAVAIGRSAACTPCMDRMFAVNTALYPTGERPQGSKPRKKHDAFRHYQKR